MNNLYITKPIKVSDEMMKVLLSTGMGRKWAIEPIDSKDISGVVSEITPMRDALRKGKYYGSRTT